MAALKIRTARAATETLLSMMVIAACGGKKDPEPLPSQTVTRVSPQLEPPPEPAPPPIRQVPAARDSVKVIDRGDSGPKKPTSLVEASRLARAQKGQAGESIASITDDNLHEYAAGGEVIVLESPPAVAPAAAAAPLEAAAAEPSSTPEDGVRDEEYWRTRALEIRMGWRRTLDLIDDLELESAALRQQFYAEEDPYIRDAQLKPAWDRILDRLDQLYERTARYEQELDLFVDEGRQAGALQGWLNQGWELEPTAEEKARTRTQRDLEIHRAVDVQTLEEDQEP